MPRERAAKAKRRKKAAKQKAAREGRQWCPKGKAAEYAAKAADKAEERRETAIKKLAQYGNGWAFGARCEGQFLALAQALAAMMGARAELESDPEWLHEQALVQGATHSKAARLDNTRELRAAGISVRWDDPAERGESGPITAKTAAYADPEALRIGAWERCGAEHGRFDLVCTSLPWWEHVSIGHAPGDLKQKLEERAREVRFYHFAGPEIDPEGSRYSRLVGHIPANLPVAALRRCVDELVKAWGDNPDHWRSPRQEPLRDAAGRVIYHAPGHVALARDVTRDEHGRPVQFPLFPELAQKLNNNTNNALGPSRAGCAMAGNMAQNRTK